MMAFGFLVSAWTAYDSIDGTFYLASKYGAGKVMYLQCGEFEYWLVVSAICGLGIILSIMGAGELRKARAYKEPWL